MPDASDETEAQFMLISSLVLALVENGALRPSQLDAMRETFSMQARASRNEVKGRQCVLAAEYSEILSIVAHSASSLPVKHPGLRLVRGDGGSSDIPEQP